MQAGLKWKTAASRLLVALIAVAMIFTMTPTLGMTAYAEDGAGSETQTPVLVVTGQGVLGNGGVYSAENVSRERSYTLDELKEFGDDYVVYSQKYSAKKSKDPFAENYFLVDGVKLAALLGKEESAVDDDVFVYATDGYYVQFLHDAQYVNGRTKTVGLENPRYFYDLSTKEKGEQVPAVIGWADVNTGLTDGSTPEKLPPGKPEALGFLRLYCGQLDAEGGGAADMNQSLFNGNSVDAQVNKIQEGAAVSETALTVGSNTYTRADVLMMPFADASYTYLNSKNVEITDFVRGVPMSVLLDGYNDTDVVTFSSADDYPVKASGYTVKQLIDNDYMLAYEAGSSASEFAGVYDTAKNDPSIYGFFRLYGADENGKPAKMVDNITVTAASGEDYSNSPYKHITNGGQGGDSPYNIDSITGATLTVEGPGVKSSVPVSVRDLEGRDAGIKRADYTDKRDGSDIARTYEGIDLHFILNNMTSGDNGIKLTDKAQKVLIKNRNRKTIAEFTMDQVEEAHNSGTPILVAYGTSLTDGTNIRPFVFNNGAGADPQLGNEDGCIKLVYNKESITGDTNDKYNTFGNMAYIYVAEADTPGYKHDKAPYKSPEISNYLLTVTGEKIGREVNYTVDELENMVEYGEGGAPDNNGMGYRDEYSLANSNYWYVNEYEGVQLWKLLLKSGLDPALADDDKTIVSSTATDGYASTDKFTVKQVADPDSFGFYEKNPLDQNDGTYEGNENIREGDNVDTGDKLRTGYPVLVAYGVNGYPYVEKSSQEGYLSGLQNDGGPLRIISGKLKYNHANGSNQAKYLDKVVVGDNTYHYSTHKYHSKDVYKNLANTELSIQILNGQSEDASAIDKVTYTIGDIEKSIYEDLTRVQLSVAKVKNYYGQTKNGKVFSDLYEGMNLAFFLTDIVEIPGYKGTITFSNGTDQITMNLEDVLKAKGSNAATGIGGLYPVIAYAKNGAPLVATKNAEDGYESEVTLAEGTEYQNTITVKNNGGPLQLIFPTIDGNAEMSEKTITGINSITVNLAADKYAHIEAPYDSYKDNKVTISGEGTRLTEPKDFTVSQLEGKQTIAFTGDYSILDSEGATSQLRYRGINLYALLTSTAVGLKTNADKVIITTTDGKSKEFSLSEIRNTYTNTVTGQTGLPVLLAYGKGIAGGEDMEDGKPLVESKSSAGYDSNYSNSGGPVRLVVGQKDAEDVNSGNNLKFVSSIEVTGSDMVSWNHSVNDTFKQYLSEKVAVQVVDKQGTELFSKDYTVEEIEANTSLVERISAQTTQINTWEGIDFWGFIQQECKGIKGIENPVTIDVRANDGYTKDLRSIFALEELQNGIKDGTEYKPILLAYAIDGLPLTTGNPKQPTQFPDGEGYDATVGNNGGPIRLVTHKNQGASLSCVSSIKITVGEGGSSDPEEPAAFTIKGLGSGDIGLSIEDIANTKNSAGDVVGKAEGTYITKGTSKKVKGILLKNLLANYGVSMDDAVITLHTPDGFETSGKGASYNNISFKQAADQKYFLAYQEWNAEANEWKDIDDIVKNTDVHTNLRMYRNYCEANGLDNQTEWLDECNNIIAITVELPDMTVFKEYPVNAVRSTWMDKDGTLLVGTYGSGLNIKKAGDKEFTVLNTKSDPALKTNFTSAVAADAEGGIWVSQNASYTEPDNNQGVMYIKDGEITQYTVEANPGTIPHNYVQAIKVDTDGKVWFGSFGGLTIYDPAAGTWTTYNKTDKDFPATSINTITLDGQGGAWLGFYPDGAGTEADPYTGGFCYIDKDGNVSKKTTLVGEMTSDNTTDNTTSKLAQAWIRSIAIDKKGTVWAVAAGTNLEENEGGTIFKIKSGSSAPDNTYTGKEVFGDYLNGSTTTEVRVVAVDKDGSLWFGTSADGVLKVDNPKINAEGKMDVSVQYAKETGSWSAANMNNVYSIDFWNDGTVYVGAAGGLMVLGEEPQGGGDEPGTEPTGDATAEDAALTITGDALARDGYFSIKGIKNWEGINKLDATFHTKNSAGTEEDIAVQGATLENIFNVVGLAEGAEIDSVDIFSADGKQITYTAEKALGTSLDGNKAMFIWTEGTAKVQKVVVGQFEEGESNKGLWAKDAIRIVVNAKSGDEPAVDPAAVADEISALPQTVTVDDKDAIEKARADFDALTDEQKEELPAGTEEKLQAAEAKLEAAEARAAAEEAQQQAAAAEQAAAEARAAQAEAEQAAAEAQAAAETANQNAAEAQAAQAAAEEAAANAQAAQAAAEEAAAKAQAAQAEAEAKQAEAEAAQAAAEQAAQEATTGSAELVSAISELANTVVDAASAGYTAAKYTADTYKPYAEALEAAKAVMQKADATVSEMKAANDALAAAKAALVEKSANTLTAKGKTIKIKKKTIKKKTLKYAAKKAFTVSKAQGTVTYKKTKGNKKITVAKNGKITVKKGLKKGTYKIKVKVTAAGNDNYLAGSKTVTVTIKVK
ncbi:MAG: hypothetical protein IJH43_07830 [Mogibacterium sp.]|nr:hypothetical protein [Mogibacterium sp.]